MIRLEHTRDGHNKFYEVNIEGIAGTDYTYRYGRISNKPMSPWKLRTFSTKHQRNMAFVKILKDKLQKGYEIIDARSQILSSERQFLVAAGYEGLSSSKPTHMKQQKVKRIVKEVNDRLDRFDSILEKL